MSRREPSLRARARDILYVGSASIASAQRGNPAPPTNESDVPAQAKASVPSLTERVRDLFENSVLPVREIARLAGVTERTIYKYAAKQQWKPRYRWKPHNPAKGGNRFADKDASVQDFKPAQESKHGARHRGWNAQAVFAPAKGAGGRFVARERAGEAHPIGLKATDPAGAGHASAACVQAGKVAAAALAEAERVQRAEACIAAIGQVHAALARLNAHERKRHSKILQQRRANEADDASEAGVSDRLSLPLLVGANFALLVWERALREMAAGLRV